MNVGFWQLLIIIYHCVSYLYIYQYWFQTTENGMILFMKITNFL